MKGHDGVGNVRLVTKRESPDVVSEIIEQHEVILKTSKAQDR
jgi:hypothetical protein